MIDSGYASSASSPTSPSSPTLRSHPRTSSTSTKPKEEVRRAEKSDTIRLKDATRSFFGGMNNHSGAAREIMRCLRVAKLATDSDVDVNVGVDRKEYEGEDGSENVS